MITEAVPRLNRNLVFLLDNFEEFRFVRSMFMKPRPVRIYAQACVQATKRIASTVEKSMQAGH